MVLGITIFSYDNCNYCTNSTCFNFRGIALAVASVGKGVAWVAMATLYYAMANIFNSIVPKDKK